MFVTVCEGVSAEQISTVNELIISGCEDVSVLIQTFFKQKGILSVCEQLGAKSGGVGRRW